MVEKSFKNQKNKLRFLWNEIQDNKNDINDLEKIDIQLNSEHLTKRIVKISIASNIDLNEVEEGGGGPPIVCWVAKEVFGSWLHPNTQYTRYFILNIAPESFYNFYMKHGEKIADYISDKWYLKWLLRPLFEIFAFIGRVK